MLYPNIDPQVKYQRFKQEQYFPYKHHGFATSAIHSGQEPETIHGSINIPIHLSSTYAQKDIASLYSRFDYSRCGNPTREALQRCITQLQYAQGTLVFSSGTGATAALMHTLRRGDHILLTEDIYGGTEKYINHFSIKSHGIDAQLTDCTNIPVLLSKISKDTKMLWIQSLTNPTLKVLDIATLSREAKAINPNIKIVVDNTFCCPYTVSPLLLGADVSFNSISKYIGGHSDLIMGALAFKDEEFMQQVHFAAYSLGVNPSPFDCYLALRGLKTLELRVIQSTRNAYHIAHFLENQTCVELVNYPGLKNNKYHQLATRQMRGYGAMISFAIKGGKEQVSKLLKACKVITVATSLGGTETLVNAPTFMSLAKVPENYVRMSVGIEDLDDLIKDISQALSESQKQS